MLSPFRSPEIFFGKFFNSGNLSFVLLLLLPFVPLALFAPEFLLAALPLLCGILLKDHYEDKVNIVQQYGFEITVLLLLAFLYGASRVRQKRKLTCGMAAAVLTGCLAGYYFVGKTRCHDVDKYDEKRGRAIAFNKARKKELEFNLKCVARQRKELQAWYEREMKFLDKREAINEIYLAGALEDLTELMKVPVQSEVAQTYTEVAEENQQ